MAKSKERSASIKEAGEELPDDQWKRFEAAVYAAVKSGLKHRKGSAKANVAGEAEQKSARS